MKERVDSIVDHNRNLKRSLGAVLMIMLLGILGLRYFYPQTFENLWTGSNGDVLGTGTSNNSNRIFEHTYINTDMNFSIQYPSDVIVERNSEGFIHFFRIGPTQKEATEFYDGISLMVRSQPQGNRSLEEIAREDAARIVELELGEITEGVKEVQVNGIPGYKYTAETIAVYSKYFLEIESTGQYLEVIDSTADPESLGFHNKVQEMLSTLRVSNLRATALISSENDLIEVFDQEDDGTVTISRVTLVKPGFVIIHKANAQGRPATVIGHSDLLKGENTNVNIELNEPVSAGDLLFAILHVDDGDGVYNFPQSDPPLRDKNGFPMMTMFRIFSAEISSTRESDI
jgi:hypothetical protein